ncbi:hypothetical protein [Hymenobacter sp. BT491]|uniref:hypothetical protein n=1 Tax=Hymenobacter sp. BT491 TaxID=2766779 RepID=UPI001653E015|nr:hypothetical protein [Hymenobacter sp. BT491]MBC6988989.1 hypothetical protein [Hymenobacter sp. BT491]
MNLTLFKDELLPVYTTDLGNKVVRARELHQFLGVKERFKLMFPDVWKLKMEIMQELAPEYYQQFQVKHPSLF